MTQKPIPRTEAEVFSDIEALCTQPGYIHAAAYLCFRDNVIQYEKKVTGEDFAKMYSFKRLIRNKINVLLGCVVKTEINWTLPEQDILQEMISASDLLLSEYHHRLVYDAYSNFDAEAISGGFGPTSTGEAIREAVFYAAESAYVFQFLDMAAERYANDKTWLDANKGYLPSTARSICQALFSMQNETLISTLDQLRGKNASEWSVLSGFRLDIEEIAKKCGETEEIVESFLNSFSWPDGARNADFTEIDDFNQISVSPVLRTPEGHRYLFQYYPLVEAVYDTPFYWFAADREYFDTATKNRGDFTEAFLTDRLKVIFGEDAVFPNVDVYQGKNRLCEIDCLVLFGEYALIFQAKSQRLTLPARKGKLSKLQDNFKLAVQKAYDQAVTCAVSTKQEGVRFVCPDGREPDFSLVERAYPICVLADHYPALARRCCMELAMPVISPYP